MKYIKVLLPRKIGELDGILTYHSEDLSLKPGDAVRVPLRRNTTSAIVLGETRKPDFRTSAIKEKIYQKQLLTNEQIELLQWISKYYFCPLFNCLKLFIPKRILAGKPIKSKRNEEQIIRSEKRELTKEQSEILKEIESSEKNTFLVHGITGSGKTEVYVNIARASIEKNNQVLIMVPEISLTPQTIEYFEKSLGIKATVINSKLSEGQRYNAWMDIWTQKTQLVIGSRSAIFAPFQKLGAIIIDEEHELSYKQESSPRYSIHKVAEKMQSLSPTIKIIYGSATPSIETAEKLKESTLYLKERIGKSVLPEIEIVDLRDEFKKGNYSILSDSLRIELKKTIENKQQAIFFLNRRGSASSVVCRDCGYTEKCEECEIPKTYHSRTLEKPTLICHHCGNISKPSTTCPTCKSTNIRFLGIGTQKIESELAKEFPEIRIFRADKDTTSKKEGFKKIYKAFKNHEADVLIGTQMIAKGLHLPKVNLVGVILADIGLNIPDFRASERNFQLMTQVAGRAGRSKNKGKVIIQTYNPDNIALTLTKSHDYTSFFKYERSQRNLLKNPPFSKLAKLQIEDTNFNKCKNIAEDIENNLWKIAQEKNITDQLEINVYPAYIPKLRGKYRYLTLIKSKASDDSLHKILEKLPKEYIINPNIKIDIDPISIT